MTPQRHHPLLDRVGHYIARERLLTPHARVLVAVSGGADSVALLHMLHTLGYACEAVHCNFALRASESERDEAFVTHLCRTWNIPLHTTRFDTASHATRQGISVEMAARELRYAYFEQLRQRLQAEAVAVGHHRDDSVETFLLNLLRGTGLKELHGILPLRAHVVRPLLCLGRSEVEAYLQHMGQEYMTDSTNTEDIYLRNKVRLQLIPLMKTLNPSIVQSLQQTISNLQGVEAIYLQGVEAARARVLDSQGINIETLRKETSPETLLFELLHPLGFSTSTIQDIYRSIDGQAGKMFVGKKGRVVKDRSHLLILPPKAEENTEVPPFNIEQRRLMRTPDFRIPIDPYTACLDADKLHAPLAFRPWRPGDSFVPLGMKGRKRVSDYLTDRKCSLAEKEQQWVACCREEIVWLVGHRIDNRFKIDAQTKQLLLVTVT